MTTDGQVQQLLAALNAQTRVLERIEKHLRPKVADARPIQRPNIQEPAAGVGYPAIHLDHVTGEASFSVPDGIEPMSEND